MPQHAKAVVESAADPRPTPIRTFPDIPGQRHLATSGQLRDHGWSTDAIRHARDRTIQQAYPKVFAPHLGPLEADDRLVAAYLWAGEGAVLTGRVALQRLGLEVRSEGRCMFLVPNTHRARTAPGVATVRTTRPVPIAAMRDCVPLTDVARALGDAATHQHLTGNELRATTIAALQGRFTHVDGLEVELQQRPPNGFAPIRQALDQFRAGAWSLPEAALASLIAQDPALPEYLLNIDLRTSDGTWIGRPDGYFPSSGVAAQVHSRAFHSGVDNEGRDRWSTTVERDGLMIEHGVIVVGVTPSSIERRPEQVLARLRRVVAANSGRELPEVTVHHRAGDEPRLNPVNCGEI